MPSIRGLVAFMLMTFFGMSGAKWVLDAMGMEEVGTTGAVIFFCIPVAVVYYLWDRWGRQAADAMPG